MACVQRQRGGARAASAAMAQPSAKNRGQDDDHPGEREQVGVRRPETKPGLERAGGSRRERVVEQIGHGAKPDERQAGA